MNRKSKANNENDFEGQLLSKIASTSLTPLTPAFFFVNGGHYVLLAMPRAAHAFCADYNIPGNEKNPY